MPVKISSLVGLSSQNISQIDYFSFLIGIRQLLNNDITFQFTCKDCGQQFQYTIHLDQTFQQIILSYQRKTATFIKTDQNNIEWKFQLQSYSMKDFLIFQNFINKMQQVDEDISNSVILRALLYITNVYKNNEKIDDWNQHTLLEKYNFLKSISLSILYDVRKEKTNNFLMQFIKNTFDQQKFTQFTENIKISCSSCGSQYTNVFNFEDLFFILGYQKDNQDIFSDILQAQSYLVYYHWFSISQINNMSYLDFTIYSQKIFTLYQEQQKQKQQQMKEMEAQMQNISMDY